MENKNKSVNEISPMPKSIHSLEERFNSLFGGRQSPVGLAAFRTFADRFIETIDHRLEALNDHIILQKRFELQNLVHQMRSTFATLGADDIESAASLLETRCRAVEQLDYTEARNFVATLRQRLPLIKKELSDFLDTLPSSTTAAKPH